MDGRSRIAWNLRRIRSARHLTQEGLAFEARIDRSTVSEIENGKFNPSIDLLEKLSAVLGVDVLDLLAIPPVEEEPPSPMRSGRKPKQN